MYNPKDDIKVLFEYAKHNKHIVSKDNSIKLHRYLVTTINALAIGCILGLLTLTISILF